MDLVISPFPLWIDFSSRPSSTEKENKSIYFFAVVVVIAGLVMGLNSVTLFMLIDPFLLLGQPEPSRLGSAPGVNGALFVPTRVTFPVPRRVVLLAGRTGAAGCCRHFIRAQLFMCAVICNCCHCHNLVTAVNGLFTIQSRVSLLDGEREAVLHKGSLFNNNNTTTTTTAVGRVLTSS